MPVSAFELFTIGIGPSSSHTVGPMRAAAIVAKRLGGLAPASLRVTLHGSLAATCRGHGTDRALLAGLAGHAPETVDPDLVSGLSSDGSVVVGQHILEPGAYELVLAAGGGPDGHPNALRFEGLDSMGSVLVDTVFRSVGGGFITEDGEPTPVADPLPAEYQTAAELVEQARDLGGFAAVAEANERARRNQAEVDARLSTIATAMDDCIERGLRQEGELPGGLRVRRRAPALHRSLTGVGGSAQAFEWAGLWAMAVNEENAAGGRVVTAPTNGAAGVLPAVIRYATIFEGVDEGGVGRMLLAAAAVGALIKARASISGAEVGCQGEVGSAAAMAAAGLAEALGATPAQTANAAEIALEHHLGMTCDPIGGLVQVPCIERNGIATAKAIAAAKLALRGDGRHVVSLDQVIEAMRRTGADMREEYKETSRGGLAVSVPAC